jgi:N-terminal domain of anti-restriction factor ArdC
MSRSAARAHAGRDRPSLYQEITDKIIAELDAGRVPWVQPWGTVAAKASLTMPKNAATHRQYSGINVLILWSAVIDRGNNRDFLCGLDTHRHERRWVVLVVMQAGRFTGLATVWSIWDQLQCVP